MASHVALLRGINVGGRNKIPMTDLRAVATSLGHTGVTTYIQSGNVLFSTEKIDTARLAADLELAITDAFGVKVPVVVLSREQLTVIANDNPYSHELNPKLVHVVFLNAEPGPGQLDRIATAQREAAAKGSRDSITPADRALFLHTPDGFGTSELAQALLRIVSGPGATGTARNWATTTKLIALCGG
jgi:uncharacterized protein (DUF1697 family)